MSRPETAPFRISGVDEDIPDILTLEVTAACNSACAHCFARGGRRGGMAMPGETIVAAVGEGFDLGYRNLHLTGGEPFLRGDILNIIETALALGYGSLSINTNGTLLDERLCRALSAYGGRLTLSVSLDGSRECHDEARGAGTWAAACRGLVTALDRGIAAAVFTMARRAVLPELPRFSEFVFRSFPAARDIVLIIPVGPAEAERPSPGEFLSLVRTAALLNLYGHRVSFLDSPLSRAAARLMKTPWIPASVPLVRRRNIVVLSDGTLTLSHSSAASLGVYRAGTLGGVLDSAAYLGAVSPDGIVCPSCEFYGLCRDSGLIRPSGGKSGVEKDGLFCREVLGMARS
jgi:MoaA/NifB/PqqE/SkfB family radical SAM enzyme